MPSVLTKKDIQGLMTATRRFVGLSEWALDAESDQNGPVEAQAFLQGLMGLLGVETAEEKSPGETHKIAGE